MKERLFGDSDFYIGHGYKGKIEGNIVCIIDKFSLMKLPVNEFGEIVLIVGKVKFPPKYKSVTHFVGGVKNIILEAENEKWLNKGNIESLDNILNNPFDKIGDIKE